MPSSERSIRVEAIVLRHADWGEADRLLVLYTRERGKLRAVGKGVRRLRSRKAGHLEPFTRVKLQLARGRDFWIVTQAETIEAYLPLRDDLLTTGYAAYSVELLDRFTYEEGENGALFSLLSDTLSRLSKVEDAFIAVRYYEIRLLDLLGFRPQLLNCVRCQAEIKPEDQFFSFQQGGVLCPKCGALDHDSRPISMRALKYLRHFQRSNYMEVKRAGLPEEVRPELESLFQSFFSFLLERGLNSASFIRTVRNGAMPRF